MQTRHKAEEIARRGQEIFETQIRPKEEAGNLGRFVVIDIESGDYELADDENGILSATDRLRVRRPKANLFTARIGYPAATFIGTVPQPGQLR